MSSPNVLERKVSRYYGANPLAFKLLLNAFSYEVVHCDSTGNACIFVEKSFVPQTCPQTFSLPQFTHPLFRAVEETHKTPILLTNELLVKIIDNHLVQVLSNSSLLTSHDSHQHFNEKMSIQYLNYEAYVSKEEFSDMSTEGKCLLNNTCVNVSIASVRDLLSETPKSRHNQLFSERSTFLCLQSTSLSQFCSSIARLYFKKFLYWLSKSEKVEQGWALLEQGFLHDPRDPFIRAVYRYRNMIDYMMTTNATKSYSFSLLHIRGIDKFRPVGAGICDNIIHRIANDRVFGAITRSLFSAYLYDIEKNFFFNLISDDQHIALRDIDKISDQNPYYSSNETLLHTLVPPGFSDSLIVSEAQQRVYDICQRRSTLKSILIFGLEPSSVKKIEGQFLQQTRDSTEFLFHQQLSSLNAQILQTIGCDSDMIMPLKQYCRNTLIDMAMGFLPKLPEFDRYWNDLSQSVYLQRLDLRSEVTIGIDPLLIFTAPFWHWPLGNVELIVVLMNVDEALQCISNTADISPMEALPLLTLYFEAMVQTISSFKDVTFVRMESLLEARGLFGDGVDVELKRGADWGCGLTDQLTNFSFIPNWVRRCYDYITNKNDVNSDLCLAKDNI